MRLIKPSFSIWDQQEGLEGIYKQIERAGRVCYKSEDKITEDSAKDFVDRMIKLGHGAMLEHGTIYLIIDCSGRLLDVANKYVNNKYSEWTLHPDGVHYCITTNYRVLLQNGWLDDLQYLCEPTEYHEKRVTVHFVCDRGVSHEYVRHRVFSFAQESTRYCNYSKDKFQGVTYIQPPWLDGDISNEDGSKFNDVYTDIYLHTLTTAENAYLDLLKQWDNKVPDKRFKSGYKNNPWTPQQARAVLPNSLKTELVMTGFVSDWEHFFKLRDAGSAHPQARELAHPLHMEFLRRNYLVDLYDEANPD
jgi:thymidylate synthase (FAD)